jgi:hypothetical protein
MSRNNILFECVSWSRAVFSLDDHGQERFETWAESDSHVVPHTTMVVILYIANSFEAIKDGLSKDGAK